MTSRTHKLSFFIVLVALCLGTVTEARAQIPYKISFQGVLRNADGTVVDDGEHEVRFALYLVEAGPMTPLWSEVQMLTTVDGVFHTHLGAVTPFPHASYFKVGLWLEISMRDGLDFAAVGPRTQLTPSPAAFHALTVATDAITTDALAPWAVLTANLAPEAVTADKLEPNAAVLNLNGLTGALSLVGGDNVTITPNGDQLVIDAVATGSGGDDGDWALDGSGNLSSNRDATVVVGSDVPTAVATGQAQLQITGDTSPALTLDDHGTRRWSLVNKIADQDLHVGFTNAANVVPDGILVVDDDGQVGIGLTPEATLDIDGGNWLLSSSPGDLQIGNNGNVMRFGVNTSAGKGFIRVRSNSPSNAPLLNLGVGDFSQLSILEDYLRFYVDDELKARFWGGDVEDAGGQLFMYGSSSAVHTVELDGDTGSGGMVAVSTSAGVPGVLVDATTTGGRVLVRDATGSPTVTIDGQYSDGLGRVQTQVLEITGGSDLSEQFEVQFEDVHDELAPGTVVSIDPRRPGGLQVCDVAYDRKVAGIISGAGGVRPGMLMGQKGSVADGEHPVALTGRVYVKADTSSGAIEPGDLLTTSSRPGHAMRVTDHARANGAILGKAMTALDEGTGLVLVLVSLQ